MGVCVCGAALAVRYDLEPEEPRPDEGVDMWRYAALLPVRDASSIRSMGEGWTPLIRARRLGDALGGVDLWIKDESRNPAGSWEARGYSCAVSCALEAGRAAVSAFPSAEAAAACAAYAAAAGLEARVKIDACWPEPFRVACRAAGAADGGSWQPDPFRVEGLKTVAFEIAEQLGPRTIRLIACPAGDGLAALRKGWSELEALGWAPAPAPGIECPAEGGLRESIDTGLEMARLAGVLPSVESAACLTGIRRRVEDGTLARGDTVVLVNTAAGMLYAEIYARRFAGGAVIETDKLGGLITPR